MPKHILIAEDEEHVRDMLVKLVSDYKVTAVNNGEEALQVYKANRPDLLITDYDMPNMNGKELVDRIREDDRELPIILLHESNVSPESCRADRVWRKPGDFHRIRQYVVQCLK